MQNRADFLISAVRYNDDHLHIIQLSVHPDNGNTLGVKSIRTRQEVIVAIKGGFTFFTVYKNGNNKWQRGQKVIIIKVNGVEYIRTTDNGRSSDNLENLPEF